MSVDRDVDRQGRPRRARAVRGGEPEKMVAIRDHAVEHGLIVHRFYGSDGQIMVIDEWPDGQSFLDFFGHMQSEIGSMMEEAGITGEPNPNFWRKIEAHDDYGWDA